ncbi:MAG: NUDIX domain-containing protein [Ktedonobacteraceae bacterium]|nr:NUDIX domain-containing protein [Chloroflexota bacterium]
MAEATYRYCPSCAASLVEKQVGQVMHSVCPACGFILFLEPKLVTVVVVQHNGRILLGRRNIEPGMGQWSFFGGYVDRGEQVEAAALREVKEETNLDVRLDGLIGLYSAAGRPHVLVAYRASVLNNDISALALQPEEVSELAFFAPDEMPELAFPFDAQILHDGLGEI